jgi:hypothetical protein
MLSTSECYGILRLRPGASAEEVRQAFRRLAKELHPDQNPAADAHDRFILLHEAYERLRKRPQGVAGSESSYREEAVRMQRTRQRAAAYARMRYEEYEREKALYHTSPYAWVFRILYYGLFLIYLFCAMLFAAIPLVLAGYSWKWLAISSPLWVLSYFTFSYAYQWKREIDPLFE